MGSASGATTIRKCGEQHSVTNSKNITTPVFTCSNFSPNTASLLNKTKQGFLKTWLGLTEKLINEHLDKSRNTTMGHLHTRRQWLKSTKEKPTDKDLEEEKKM